MILKNKRTRERLELTEAEFKKRFAKEINDSLESYKRSVMAKTMFLPFKINNDIERDYYFNLLWNFNNHGISNWYIERI